MPARRVCVCTSVCCYCFYRELKYVFPPKIGLSKRAQFTIPNYICSNSLQPSNFYVALFLLTHKMKSHELALLHTHTLPLRNRFVAHSSYRHNPRTAADRQRRNTTQQHDTEQTAHKHNLVSCTPRAKCLKINFFI